MTTAIERNADGAISFETEENLDAISSKVAREFKSGFRDYRDFFFNSQF
jgi:hypothetical protein